MLMIEKIQQVYNIFLISPSGRRFVVALSRPLIRLLKKSNATFVESINYYFEENEWRLADFLTISPSDDQEFYPANLPHS